MTVLKAHFDGKVLVPDEPVDLPMNCPLEVQVIRQNEHHQFAQKPEEDTLMKLVELARKFPVAPGAPSDGAAQHDHYLYGLPKRP